jgi:hypothetical protein
MHLFHLLHQLSLLLLFVCLFVWSFVFLADLLLFLFSRLLSPLPPDLYFSSSSAGYGMVDEKAGNLLYTEYQQAPRAKIFRRDQGTVSDMASMQHLMR